MSRRRWIRRVRHRARRGRRHLPARAGSDSPSASGRRGWHRAAGRAGRSGCRPAANRAAPCRAPLRRAPAARAAPAIPAARERLRAQPMRPAGRRWFRRRRPRLVAVLGVEPRRQLPREFVEGAVFNRRQRWLLRFARGAERQDVCGSVCRQLRCGFRQRVLDDFSWTLSRSGRFPLRLPWEVPRAFPNLFDVKALQQKSRAARSFGSNRFRQFVG